MSNNFLTVITPTTGKASLHKLIMSIDSQEHNEVFHLLLWDNVRETDIRPESLNKKK